MHLNGRVYVDGVMGGGIALSQAQRRVLSSLPSSSPRSGRTGRCRSSSPRSTATSSENHFAEVLVDDACLPDQVAALATLAWNRSQR